VEADAVLHQCRENGKRRCSVKGKGDALSRGDADDVEEH